MFTKNLIFLLMRITLVLVLIIGLFWLQPIMSVRADTLIVTNANSSGTGSLPYLIASAPAGGIITFAPSLAGQTITLPSDINIIKDLTIDGSGLSPQVTVSGRGAYHLKIVFSIDLTISDLTFTNGYNSGNGGAIEFLGTGGHLSLSNVAFNNNTADGSGGAVSFRSGSFVVSNSSFSQNRASNDGGALEANGTGPLTITNSAFMQNSAGDDGGAILVGAISNNTIVDSAFTQNQAGGDGGAILDNGSLTIKNSTISQNIANYSGGAIAYEGLGYPIIINSTITLNQAGSRGGALFLTGGDDVEIFNSTFAEDEAPTGSEVYHNGQTVLSAYNTIFACSPTAFTCYFSMGASILSLINSIMDVGTLADFGLAELADNGGLTKTMALYGNSPLINTGDDAICANISVGSLDQRGVTRPQGTHCDIGAYEADGTFIPTATLTPSITPSPTPSNTPITPSVTLTPSNTPVTPTVTNTPSLTPSNTPVTPTVTLTPSNTPITPTVTLTPSNTPVTPSVTLTPSNTPVTLTVTFTPVWTPTLVTTATKSSTPLPTFTPSRPYLRSAIVAPASILSLSGTTSGSHSSLSLLDQTGTADDPAAYVMFQTPKGAYIGYQTFTLPDGVQANLVSTMLLQVNFKAPETSQIWIWCIYDWNSGMWIQIGDSIGAKPSEWKALTFRIRQTSRTISPTGEIRIQLRSNNTNGDAKIDYEGLHITYLSVPVANTPMAPVHGSGRPGTASVHNTQRP